MLSNLLGNLQVKLHVIIFHCSKKEHWHIIWYLHHQHSGQTHPNKAFHHLQMSSTDCDQVQFNCFLIVLKHKLNHVPADLTNQIWLKYFRFIYMGQSLSAPLVLRSLPWHTELFYGKRREEGREGVQHKILSQNMVCSQCPHLREHKTYFQKTVFGS